MSTRDDLKQGLEEFARYFTLLETQPLELAVAINLILNALTPEADTPRVEPKKVGASDIMSHEPPVRSWGSWAIVKSQIRLLMSEAWQEGYDRRDKREPGGTANNPYHENYQGISPVLGAKAQSESWEDWEGERTELLSENARLRMELLEKSKAYESWIEERAALLAENSSLRMQEDYSKHFREAQSSDVAEAHKWRREAAAAVGLSVESSWPELLGRITRCAEVSAHQTFGEYNWSTWALTIVGGGNGLTSFELFERTKEEVAILLEVSRRNERKAMQALKVLMDYRRLVTERGKLGPFHGAESARALDLLSRLEYEQLGPSYGA